MHKHTNIHTYLGYHFTLVPMLAGGAMAMSSVCIVLSSLLLLLYKPPMLVGEYAKNEWSDASGNTGKNSAYNTNNNPQKYDIEDHIDITDTCQCPASLAPILIIHEKNLLQKIQIIINKNFNYFLLSFSTKQNSKNVSGNYKKIGGYTSNGSSNKNRNKNNYVFSSLSTYDEENKYENSNINDNNNNSNKDYNGNYDNNNDNDNDRDKIDAVVSDVSRFLLDDNYEENYGNSIYNNNDGGDNTDESKDDNYDNNNNNNINNYRKNFLPLNSSKLSSLKKRNKKIDRNKDRNQNNSMGCSCNKWNCRCGSECACGNN